MVISTLGTILCSTSSKIHNLLLYQTSVKHNKTMWKDEMPLWAIRKMHFTIFWGDFKVAKPISYQRSCERLSGLHQTLKTCCVIPHSKATFLGFCLLLNPNHNLQNIFAVQSAPCWVMLNVSALPEVRCCHTKREPQRGVEDSSLVTTRTQTRRVSKALSCQSADTLQITDAALAEL